MAQTETATILVVDDERELADVFKHWIDDTTPHTVHTAYDGGQALDRLDGVDVVLLDRRLPGRSGTEVLEAIEDRGDDCRVAMVTALEPEVDIVDMGIDDYLTKPVGRAELVETVERLRRRSDYHELARRHFSLLSKRAVLEERHPRGELEANEEYHDLCRRIDRTRDRMDGVLAELDDDDFRRLFADIHPPSSSETGRESLS